MFENSSNVFVVKLFTHRFGICKSHLNPAFFIIPVFFTYILNFNALPKGTLLTLGTNLMHAPLVST